MLVGVPPKEKVAGLLALLLLVPKPPAPPEALPKLKPAARRTEGELGQRNER